ncbi:Rieske (2Fe-2S) protein [Angustibacter aerolatus]
MTATSTDTRTDDRPDDRTERLSGAPSDAGGCADACGSCAAPRPSGSSRRAVVRGAGVVAAVGAGGLALAACGSDDASSDAGSGGASGAASGSAGSGGAGGAIAKVADVPVGGGLIVAAQKVVLTQPTEGEVKAFSTTCPHQGCAVTSVADGFIVCPCHNSRFAVADGAPTSDSPAKSALEAKTVTVSGGEVVLG